MSLFTRLSVKGVLIHGKWQEKPVELAVRAIDNSTEAGDLVIDFFGGSGSTLRGAELTGRRCFTIELDPRYCDVIVNSYVRLTGNTEVKCERDGEILQYSELKKCSNILNAEDSSISPGGEPEDNS